MVPSTPDTYHTTTGLVVQCIATTHTCQLTLALEKRSNRLLKYTWKTRRDFIAGFCRPICHACVEQGLEGEVGRLFLASAEMLHARGDVVTAVLLNECGAVEAPVESATKCFECQN